MSAKIDSYGSGIELDDVSDEGSEVTEKDQDDDEIDEENCQ